jgi:hypothetical protein
MIKNDDIILIEFNLRNDNEKTKMVECIIQKRDEKTISHSLTPVSFFVLSLTRIIHP